MIEKNLNEVVLPSQKKENSKKIHTMFSGVA
jgi:hypothetical protein